MEIGICAECNKPLFNSTSFGYHPRCAIIAHEREDKKVNEKYPFVVVDGIGRELERFDKLSKAEEYLHDILGSSISKAGSSKNN